MTEETTPKPGSIFFGWRVVLASFVGLMLGLPALLIFTVGVFTKPLEAEFGWTRQQVSLAAAVYTVVSMLVLPFQGALLDRFGPRRVVLVTMPLFAASVASLYFLPPSLAAYYGTWAVITVLGCGVINTSFNKAVASWFDRRLGLAIGLAVTGQGVGAALLPVIGQQLIGRFGWRLAYVGLAAISFVAITSISLLFMHDSPAARGLPLDGEAPAKGAPAVGEDGLDLRTAVRTRTFKLVAGSFVFLGIMTSAVMTHLVPMLVDRGMTPDRASFVQAVLGLSIITGRLSVGYLLDRFFAPRVLIVSLIGVVLGLLAFARGASGDLAFPAAMLIGFGLGAEIDVLGYLVPRYFGRRAYGKIYGAILAAFQLGAGIGAALLGVLRTKQGTYTLGLYLIAAGTVIAMAILSRLGAYTTSPRQR